MKKSIFVMLGVVLMFALSACGGSGSDGKSVASPASDNTNTTSKDNATDKPSSDNQKDTTATKDETGKSDTNKSTSSKSKYPFPENAKEKGKGKIVVETPAGSSENGNVPVLFVKGNTALTQIGLNASNFDGSTQTFIYVNKMFVEANQFGSRSQTSLTLQGDLLKPGTYTVSAVQFKNGDPKSGEVTAFTTAKFQIKAGK